MPVQYRGQTSKPGYTAVNTRAPFKGAALNSHPALARPSAPVGAPLAGGLAKAPPVRRPVVPRAPSTSLRSNPVAGSPLQRATAALPGKEAAQSRQQQIKGNIQRLMGQVNQTLYTGEVENLTPAQKADLQARNLIEGSRNAALVKERLKTAGEGKQAGFFGVPVLDKISSVAREGLELPVQAAAGAFHAGQMLRAWGLGGMQEKREVIDQIKAMPKVSALAALIALKPGQAVKLAGEKPLNSALEIAGAVTGSDVLAGTVARTGVLGDRLANAARLSDVGTSGLYSREPPTAETGAPLPVKPYSRGLLRKQIELKGGLKQYLPKKKLELKPEGNAAEFATKTHGLQDSSHQLVKSLDQNEGLFMGANTEHDTHMKKEFVSGIKRHGLKMNPDSGNIVIQLFNKGILPKPDVINPETGAPAWREHLTKLGREWERAPKGMNESETQRQARLNNVAEIRSALNDHELEQNIDRYYNHAKEIAGLKRELVGPLEDYTGLTPEAEAKGRLTHALTYHYPDISVTPEGQFLKKGVPIGEPAPAFTGYHGTNAAQKIRAEGFKVTSHGGRLMGNGVYLNSSAANASKFGSETLKTGADFKNPATPEQTAKYIEQARRIAQAEGVPVGSGRYAELMDRILAKNGHDAAFLTQSDGSTTLMVRDPAKARLLEEPRLHAVETDSAAKTLAHREQLTKLSQATRDKAAGKISEAEWQKIKDATDATAEARTKGIEDVTRLREGPGHEAEVGAAHRLLEAKGVDPEALSFISHNPARGENAGFSRSPETPGHGGKPESGKDQHLTGTAFKRGHVDLSYQRIIQQAVKDHKAPHLAAQHAFKNDTYAYDKQNLANQIETRLNKAQSPEARKYFEGLIDYLRNGPRYFEQSGKVSAWGRAHDISNQLMALDPQTFGVVKDGRLQPALVPGGIVHPYAGEPYRTSLLDHLEARDAIDEHNTPSPQPRTVEEQQRLGRVGLFDRRVMDRMMEYEHAKARASSPAQEIGQWWRNNAVTFSIKHYPGVLMEFMQRALANDMGPYPAMRIRQGKILRGALEAHKHTDLANYDRVLGQLGGTYMNWNRELDRYTPGASLKDLTNHQVPVGAKVAAPFREWMKLTQHIQNQWRHFESKYQLAGLGQHFDQELKRLGQPGIGLRKISDQMQAELAKGILNDKTVNAFLEDGKRKWGDWQSASPAAKRFSVVMPWFRWYKVALEFVYKTMPIDHPTKTGIAALLHSMSQAQLEHEGQGYGSLGAALTGASPKNALTSWQQGSLPVGGGNRWDFQYYSPVGSVSEGIKGGLGSMIPWANVASEAINKFGEGQEKGLPSAIAESLFPPARYLTSILAEGKPVGKTLLPVRIEQEKQGKANTPLLPNSAFEGAPLPGALKSKVKPLKIKPIHPLKIKPLKIAKP